MTQRIPPHGIEATGYVGDGAQFLADDGTWKAGAGGVSSVVAGTGIAVDSTDPANPVVSATGVGGGGSFSARAAKAGDQTINSTASTALTGMSVTIPVASTSDVFLIHVTLDAESTGSGILIGKVHIGGVADSTWLVSRLPNANRLPVSNTYRITGFGAGNLVVDVRAQMAAASTSYVVYGTHSTITAVQV